VHAIDPEDPNYTSFELGRNLMVGLPDEPLGALKIPLRERVRFLLTGRIEIAATLRGGNRVSLHTPRVRNFPLILLGRLTRKEAH
jgi:hypothetical protein